ncbi:MAG: DUF6650 family protein [Pseudomonadota bacterium]
MKFKEVMSRVTGLSSPIGGISWNPPEAQVTTARKLITFLEDRRVLYNPSEMEVPHHCVHSVMDIRHFLTDLLQTAEAGSEIAQSIRALRAACRKFMDTVGRDDRVVMHGAEMGHFASWEFNGAVGELRGVFGVHIARIAVAHGLNVEDGLAAIIPAADE